MRSIIALVSLAVGTSAFGDESRASVIVREWQAQNAKIRDLQFDYESTYEDLLFQSKSVERGKVVWSRVNLLRLDWKSDSEQRALVIADGKKTFYDLRQEIAMETGKPGWPRKPDRLEALLIDVIDEVYQSLAESFIVSLSGAAIDKEFKVTLVDEDEASIRLRLVRRDQKNVSLFETSLVRLDKRTFLVTQATFDSFDRYRIVRVYKNHKVNAEPPVSREQLSKGLPKGSRNIP